MTRARWAASAVVLAVALVALTGLVQAGATETADRAAHRELSPLGAGPHGRGRAAPLRLVGDTLRALREPAAPGVTLLLAAAGCIALRRRRRAGDAAAWAGAFGLALVLESILKVVVDQRMPGIPREVTALGTVSPGSYPSGHVARAVLLAGLGAALWPAVRRPLCAWPAAVAAAILLLGMHLASDVAGGLLLGCALVAGVAAVRGGLTAADRSDRPPFGRDPAPGAPASGLAPAAVATRAPSGP